MWFERLMGFVEESPDQVRANIEHDGETLVSAVNGRRVTCGRLETPSLAELRRSTVAPTQGGARTATEVVGDVTALHEDPGNAGALFQAASQFNLLEMTGPGVTPEQVWAVASSATTMPGSKTACSAHSRWPMDWTFTSSVTADRTLW